VRVFFDIDPFHFMCLTGVPAVPPRGMGYAHFCDTPLYAYKRQLYNVPEGQSEFSIFKVVEQSRESNTDADIPSASPATESVPSSRAANTNSFPKGGHNYYNGRDLEGFRRLTGKLKKAGFPQEGWQSRLKNGKAGTGGSVKRPASG